MCKDSTTKTYTHARKSYIQNSENMTRQYIGTWAKLRYWYNKCKWCQRSLLYRGVLEFFSGSVTITT